MTEIGVFNPTLNGENRPTLTTITKVEQFEKTIRQGLKELFRERTIRKHLIFSGRVQGVGFRYRAMHMAQMLGLTGWVKNRWDGKVEMEVQGKREEIGKMISMLYQQRFIWIEDIEEKEIPVEKESSFSIH